MSTHPDEQRSRLRTIVAELELAVADGGIDNVRTSWRQLVTALDLGPEPAVRACPSCGKLGMKAATRCGFCWSATLPA
jgi:hypothetical protein